MCHHHLHLASAHANLHRSALRDALDLARDLFLGLDGDVRVKNDTIIVTYYNAQNADQLRCHYEDLPDKLSRDGVSPAIPWLYGFQLDFRFR